MKCTKVKVLISDYLDDCLPETICLSVEAHLAQCPGCKAEVESMRKMLVALGSLSGRRSPVDCWEHVQASIEEMKAHRTTWWRWMLRPIIAAPTFAATAALALFLVWPNQGQMPPSSTAAFAPEYSSYIGAHSHLQRQQAFTDPDVTFVSAELEKANLVSYQSK